jgi:hypothetical protein
MASPQEMIYLPVAAIIVSICGLLFQYFGVITRILERLTRIETKTDLFWKCVESGVVTMLKTYPSKVAKDVLLDKMVHNELALQEAQELRTILCEEMKPKENGAERLAYVLALARLEQIIFDLNPRR